VTLPENRKGDAGGSNSSEGKKGNGEKGGTVEKRLGKLLRTGKSQFTAENSKKVEDQYPAWKGKEKNWRDPLAGKKGKEVKHDPI